MLGSVAAADHLSLVTDATSSSQRSQVSKREIMTLDANKDHPNVRTTG